MMQAFIIKNPNTRNPQTKELAAEICEEFEFVHASCADPTLSGNVLITT